MIRTALVCFSLWIVCAFAGAAEQPPWLKDVDYGRPGSFPRLKPCRVEYAFSWSNIVKAGEAEVTVGAVEDRKFPRKLVVQSSGGSRGMARALWPYDHKFTSVIDPASFRPILFQSTEVDRKETLWTTLVYKSSGVDVEWITKEKESGTRVENTRVFPIPECHDLASAFLYARSLPLETGDEIVLLAHPFGSPYLGRLKVLGREKHKIGLGEFDAIKFDIQVSKVQGDLKLKPYTKFKKATAWVSDDEYRVPLELRAEIFVGSVRAILTERQPLEPSRVASPAPAKTVVPPATTVVPKGPEEKLLKWFKSGTGRSGGSPFRRR